MGCFNHKCNFSQLPVKYGDRIVVVLGVKPIGPAEHMMDIDNFSPGNSFTPISVPIRGEYNDYGGIQNVDMTPGIEVLENYFDMGIEEIVDIAERVTCGCKNQEEDTYKKIKDILTDKKLSFLYKNVELTYIMEHEDIFDDMINRSNLAYKNRYFWRIPHEFLNDIGYIENNLGKNNNNYDIIEWTHPTLPKLKEECYIYRTEDVGDYNKVCNTIEEFAKYIGAEIPEKYNRSYYECRFIEDIKTMSDESLSRIDKRLRAYENRHYSFLKFAEYGLFHQGEHTGIFSYLLCSFGNNDEHMQEKFMKEVIEIALLYDALRLMEMTWGNTSYYRQDISYEPHIEFLKKCLEVAESKRKEYDYVEE